MTMPAPPLQSSADGGPRHPPTAARARCGRRLRGQRDDRRKWCARAAAEGPAGPRIAVPTPLAERHPGLCGGTHARAASPRWTCAGIGRTLGVATATVTRHLKRRGLSRLTALDPSEPARRYQRRAPGELSTSTSRSSAGSSGSVTASRAIAGTAPVALAGVRSRRHRRRLAACLHRGPARRAQGERHRLPRPGACLGSARWGSRSHAS